MRPLVASLLLAALPVVAQDPANPVAERMVAGMRAYLLRLASQTETQRRPSADKLRFSLGVVDRRADETAPEIIGTIAQPAERFRGSGYAVWNVRWRALDAMHGAGLLFRPSAAIRARVVALPDAGQDPEQFAEAHALAAAGAQVLVPLLVDRDSQWSGNPRLRMTKHSHREFIYRMGFPLGRHVIGYEVQKTLAAIDWFARERSAESADAPIAVWGRGEGGMVALFAAALDPRISQAFVDGYHGPSASPWDEPIDRNVWGLLKDFSPAAIETMIKPRQLARGVSVARVLRALGLPTAASATIPALTPPPERRQQNFDEMIRFTQALIRPSEKVREALWNSAGPPEVRRQLREQVLGELPPEEMPLNPRVKPIGASARWTAFEVELDIRPEFFAWGVLLLPNDLAPGERRPAVVVQHGLQGRPSDLYGQPEGSRTREVYQNLGETLADLGYVVYLPQNPYAGDRFRELTRISHPLGLTLFSLIRTQYARTMDWLSAHPAVDAARIGFYGLSYGGTTALRVPPLDERFQVAVCSGNFNEWVYKLSAYDAPYSYVFTQEYEIVEWNLANVASHAEMAMLMFPRPFLVERGHRDGVGTDEWVSYEFARVRRYYDEAGLGDRAAITYFNGVHRIHGREALTFLRRFLGR